MWPLAAAIFDIATHRRGPEVLPASQFLLGMLVALYLIVGLIVLSALGLLTAAEATLLLVDCVFYLAFVFVTLRLFGRERRFRQTASALLGTDVLLNLIGLPLAYWAGAGGVEANQVTVPMVLRLVLLLWWIDVAGFILGRALGRPYLVGVLFVIMYVIVSLNIRDVFAPATN